MIFFEFFFIFLYFCLLIDPRLQIFTRHCQIFLFQCYSILSYNCSSLAFRWISPYFIISISTFHQLSTTLKHSHLLLQTFTNSAWLGCPILTDCELTKFTENLQFSQINGVDRVKSFQVGNNGKYHFGKIKPHPTGERRGGG